MAPYTKGTLVRVIGQFATGEGSGDLNALGDPTTVSFKFKNPAGTITTYTFPASPQLVRDREGEYHVDVDADAVGTWHWRWQSTGSFQGAKEGSFEVPDSPF